MKMKRCHVCGDFTEDPLYDVSGDDGENIVDLYLCRECYEERYPEASFNIPDDPVRIPFDSPEEV